MKTARQTSPARTSVLAKTPISLTDLVVRTPRVSAQPGTDTAGFVGGAGRAVGQRGLADARLRSDTKRRRRHRQLRRRCGEACTVDEQDGARATCDVTITDATEGARALAIAVSDDLGNASALEPCSCDRRSSSAPWRAPLTPMPTRSVGLCSPKALASTSARSTGPACTSPPRSRSGARRLAARWGRAALKTRTKPS